MKREVRIGTKFIGGENPILIQSMTNTKTEDIDSTVKQILALEEVGCEIIRVTANTIEAAKAIKEIKSKINIPIIADIHFSSRMAIEAIKAGADKIRINPGNMKIDNLDEILDFAKKKDIAIRIGINSGSVEREFLDKYGMGETAMLKSMEKYIKYFESQNFFNIVLSCKSSDVKLNIKVNRLLDEKFNYPIHLGVTEAGLYEDAVIKSSVGVGALLVDGIGQTIRISITGDPLLEIPVAKSLLKSIGLGSGVNIISCPTCGRCEYNMVDIANRVREKTINIDKNINVAIMGCVVNGPGEAKEADIGIAGGKGNAVLFKKGEIVKKLKESEIADILIEEIKDL